MFPTIIHFPTSKSFVTLSIFLTWIWHLSRSITAQEVEYDTPWAVRGSSFISSFISVVCSPRLGEGGVFNSSVSCHLISHVSVSHSSAQMSCQTNVCKINVKSNFLSLFVTWFRLLFSFVFYFFVKVYVGVNKFLVFLMSRNFTWPLATTHYYHRDHIVRNDHEDHLRKTWGEQCVRMTSWEISSSSLLVLQCIFFGRNRYLHWVMSC